LSKALVGAIEIGAAVGLAAATGGAGGILAVAELKGGGFLADLAVSALISGVSMEAGAVADALTQNRGMGITTRQPASYRQIIYGTQRVGGIMVYCSTTGSKHDQYNMVIVLATHECDAIQNLYLDGRRVAWESGSAGQAKSSRNGYTFGGSAADQDLIGPNGQHYNFGSLVYCEARFGDQAEDDVISGLTANDPNWAATAQGSPWLGGCTYIYLKLKADPNMFPQFPEIRFTINGKNNIYDPRTGTSGFTTNWALIAADVIVDPVWGLGSNTVNQDQLVAAANVCDEQVALAAGGTESRLACHWHYDTSTSPGDVLNTLMTTNEGRISRVGGEWFIYPPYWTGVTFSFDENALLGPTISWNPKRSVSDLVNRVTGTYIAPNYPYNVAGNLYDENGWYSGTIQNNWPYAFQPTNYPDFACDQDHGYGTGVDVYLTQDLEIPHPKDLVQPTCLSIAQAQRTAAVSLFRNRQQGSGTLIMNMSAWQMEPGDIMQFSFAPLGWVNKYLEVSLLTLKTGQSQDASGNSVPYQYVEVQVQEADPSVYDWQTSLELNAYDVETAPPATPYNVDAPTGLTIEDDSTTQLVLQDGTTMPRVLVTWTPPEDTYVANGGHIEVQYSLATTANKPMPEILNPVHNPNDNTYSTGWLDAGNYPGIATTCFINSINASQYQNITVQVRAVRSNGASSEWVQVNNHGLNTSQPTIAAGAVTFAETGETLETLEPVSAASAAVVLTATGNQRNLVPDSDLKFTSAYWTLNASIPVANAAGADGANAFVYTGTGSASGYLYNRSAPIPVIPGQSYILSGYIDATAVTAGDDPYWGVYHADMSAMIAGQVQTPGRSGRVSITLTIPSGVTEVRVVCDTSDCTVTSGSKLIFSNPQLELGSVMTSYKSNSADDTSDGWLHETMSSEVQSAIEAGTGQVQNLGGVAASSITPISTLMPAQAGADVTAQAGFVTILNPSFANQGTNWSLQSGWSIQSGYQPQTGSNYVSQFSASATSACVNLSKVPCQAGDVLSATAMALINTKPTGAVCVRINFYNASGTAIATIDGNDISGSTLNAVVFSRCTATAGAGTAYASFDFAVFTTAHAIVNLYSMTSNLNLRSLDELPDGPTYQRPLYITNGVYTTSKGLVQQGSITNLAEGGDGSVLSYTANNSSIVMSWVAFYIYAPDGNVYTCPAGSKTFSSLAASTKYYFCAYYHLVSNALVVSSTGTVASTLQFQAQTVQGDGNVGVCIDFTCSTTGSSGQSGGTSPGGGGGRVCFSPNTLVLVQRDGEEVAVPIAEVRQGDLVTTLLGTRRQVFYVSATRYCGSMQIVPEVGLSTPNHQMWDGSAWVNASVLYPTEIPYEGTIHNLHIDTETDDEHSYTLANGQVVHNLFTNPE
jgi:hypothetical protein